MKIHSALIHIVDNKVEMIIRDEKGNDQTFVDAEAWKALRSIGVMKQGNRIVGLEYSPKK